MGYVERMTHELARELGKGMYSRGKPLNAPNPAQDRYRILFFAMIPAPFIVLGIVLWLVNATARTWAEIGITAGVLGGLTVLIALVVISNRHEARL
jgi:hypothetical protein